MQYVNRIVVVLGIIVAIALMVGGKIPAGIIVLITSAITLAAMTAWKDMRYTSFGGFLLIVIAAIVLIASDYLLTGQFMLLLAVIAFAVMVWVETIGFMIRASQAKGFHRDSSASLWFIGLFASPIMLGLYTASLPDRGQIQAPVAAPEQRLRDEFPRI